MHLVVHPSGAAPALLTDFWMHTVNVTGKKAWEKWVTSTGLEQRDHSPCPHASSPLCSGSGNWVQVCLLAARAEMQSSGILIPRLYSAEA